MSDSPIKLAFKKETGTVLFNPTNEDFDKLQYAGVSFSIKSGEKIEVPTNCGNHIMNSYEQRGLCRLIYGADEAKVAEQGRAKNAEFKQRTVAKFNEVNANRKSQGLGSHIPSGEMRKYASELKVELDEPYAPRDEEKVKIQSQEATISSLQATLASLMAKMDTMATAQARQTMGNGPEKDTQKISGLAPIIMDTMAKEDGGFKSERRVRKDGKWVKEWSEQDTNQKQ